MKKILVSIGLAALLSNAAFADYKVFTNKSEPFVDSQINKKEVIFFGELEDYRKSLEEIQKNIAAHGVVAAANGLSGQSANLAKGLLGEGLKAGATGLGIGILIGALDPFVMSIYADQYYVQVYKVELKNGKTVYMNKFLVGDKHPKLSEKEVKSILGGE
jgi:hypothetical protein